MPEVAELPSDQTILQEAEQEKITFSAENCFKIIPVGTIPPDTTPKLDAYRLISEQEKFYEQFTVEMPPIWQSLVEECGQDIIKKAAELGVTIEGIENFYPHFVLRHEYEDVDAKEGWLGFANARSRRPIVFVDSLTTELTLNYIGTIYHEMIHVLSRKKIFVRYDQSGEPRIETTLGLQGIWDQNIEESIAHREANEYLTNESMFSNMTRAHLEKLRKKTGNKVYPNLNEIQMHDKHGTAFLLDALWVSIAGPGKLSYSTSNIGDRFVQTVLDFLPDSEKKTVEFLFKKSRFAEDYKYANLARRIIRKYWGDSAYDTIIENTKYEDNSINKSLQELERIKKNKQSHLANTEDIPHTLSELVK